MNDPQDKPCPFCGEMIKTEAIKCRFCGEFLNDATGAIPSQAASKDAVVFFSGHVSSIVLVGPTLALIFWIAIACLIIFVGGPAIKNPTLAKLPLPIGIGIAVIAALNWLSRWLDVKSRTYHITGDRIEYEHGIFSKTIHNVDLWRVQDITFNASFIQRLFKLGRVRIVTSDKDTPLISVGPVRNARPLYDNLKKSQLDADHRRGVIHVEP
jgi:uncharacterized membrane protein YdbT with pleckstrin-like domain